MDLKILKIASNTENHKILNNYTHKSKLKSMPCGDEMQITIKIVNDQIIKFGYEWTNKQRLQGLETATLKVNSLISGKSYYKKIIIIIKYE